MRGHSLFSPSEYPVSTNVITPNGVAHLDWHHIPGRTQGHSGVNRYLVGTTTNNATYYTHCYCGKKAKFGVQQQ